MRRYEDQVEVRRGLVGASTQSVEGPEQFLWRGRLWKVRAVLAHWVETGPWWTTVGVQAVIGSDSQPQPQPQSGLGGAAAGDLLTERELWRVEAGRGGGARRSEDDLDGAGLDGGPDGGGVFDLSFDWADGRWLLVGCMD